MRYDFFISFASADESSAEALAYKLEDKGRSFFLSSTTLEPGDQWDQGVQDALNESNVVVVLVSPNTEAAFYQREEVAHAIQKVRDDPDAYRVVPVFLPGATEAHSPFGLKIVQHLQVREQSGMDRIAFELNSSFPKVNSSSGVTVQNKIYYGLGATLRLDRISQWNGVLMSGATGSNTLFLLRGRKNQNVDLFLDRIERFFAQESARPRSVCRVRYNLQGQTPRNGADWVAHMKASLGTKGADLSAALKQTANSQQIFVILGEKPLAIERMSENHLDALHEFLGDELPNLLNNIGLGAGFDMMLPFHYDEDVPDRFETIEKWCLELEERCQGAVYFHRLPEVCSPTWDDVEEFLGTHRPRPSGDQVEVIRREFEQRAERPNMTFIELAEIIDEVMMMRS